MAQPHVQSFVDKIWPLAVEVGDRYGIDPITIVTQAAIETGWGAEVAGNNYFGIKSHGRPGGQMVTTHEEIDGKRVKLQDSFRTYDTLAESVEDYAKFLHSNPRYANALEQEGYRDCQSAPDKDPLSASNRDPSDRFELVRRSIAGQGCGAVPEQRACLG